MPQDTQATTQSKDDMAPEPMVAPAPMAAPSEDDILEALESGASVDEAIKPREAKEEKVDPPEGSSEADTADEGEGREGIEEVGETVAAGDLERALAALRRDGYPAKIIESLDDGSIVEIGLRRAKVQADYDRAHQKATDLEKKLGELEAAKESRSEPGHAEPAGQPETVDLTELLDPISDLLGEDGSKAIGALGNTLHQKAQELVTRETKALREELSQVSAAFYELQENDARHRLSEDFPSLTDPDKYSKVRNKMATMAATGSYGDFYTLMRDAARIEFFGELPAGSKTPQSKQKRDGTPASSDRRVGAIEPEKLSRDQYEDALLNAIENGDKELLERLKRSQ